MYGCTNSPSRGGEKSGILDLAEGHVERALEASQKKKRPTGRGNCKLYYRVRAAALKQKGKTVCNVRPLTAVPKLSVIEQ